VRRGWFLFVVLAGCLLVAAAGATSKVTIPARSTVTAVAADGTQTSFATTPTATDCDRVFVWQAAKRRPVQLGKKQRCKGKSNGIAWLAMTKGRALWLTETGSPVATVRLWTASTSRPTPKALQTATRDVSAGAPEPILVGAAGGGLLPYAVGSVVTVLRSNGSTAFTWPASSAVVATSARGSRVAVAQQGARVTVLDSGGHIVSVDLFASEVSAVALTAKGLLVQRGTTLELRRGGADARQFPLSATGQLEDADSRWAAWSDGKLVHVVRLPDGAQVAAYPGTSASLTGNTLYVANGKTITIRTLR
jgi:hypothetical protein